LDDGYNDNMIAQICGKVNQIKDNSLIIDINGICYEVLVPMTILQRIVKSMPEDKILSLITYHYHQIEPSRSVPVLIGFLNKLERDFFEQFITVSGVGPKAAIKALNKPISVVARAIYNEDTNFLLGLPGIGRQRAKDIIARLQDKVGRFALLQDDAVEQAEKKQCDYEEEALQILVQLQYKKPVAKEMLKKALLRSPEINTAEALLNEVYRQNTKDAESTR